MDEQDVTYVRSEELLRVTVEILERNGVPEEDARVTADCLVSANLQGVDTHGVIRLKVYVDRIKAGGNNPRPRIRVVQETPVTAVMDGDHALGPVGGHRAMTLAIEKAKAAGVGLVTLRNSNHYGMAGYYAMMPLKHDMIGISMTNVLASMPPTGGREARIGNNPLAIAFPAGEELPVVFDAATSLSSWGQLFAAMQQGGMLPEGAFLNNEGRPTVRPEEVMDGGMLLPIAGHKGYGLALCIGLLTGVLSDGRFDIDVPHPYKHLATPGYNAFFMGAIRVDAFLPVTQFKARMDEVIRAIRGTARAPEVERIYLPGEKEHETEKERRAKGIPLNAKMREELRQMAVGAGVAFDLSGDPRRRA